MLLFLEWFKCFGDNWCSLLEIDLESRHFDDLVGIYIIWYEEGKPTVLKISQGAIRECLTVDRQDYVITAYSRYGLKVTWAQVAEDERDGIERYLGETLKPVIGNRLPDVQSIEVNLPWEKSTVLTKKI